MTIRHLITQLLAIKLVITLAACSGLTGPAQQAEIYREQQVRNGLTITLERAATPHINQQHDVIITLTDAQGKPVDHAVVYLRLIMTAHPMGMNQPIASPAGNGQYTAETIYTMDGTWDVTVVADIAGTIYEATFPILVTE